MRPNWNAAPEWANYAAQEQSGTWYWHEIKPRYQELTGEWISKGQRLIVPKVTVQAKDTMEARPVIAGDPLFDRRMSQWAKDCKAGDCDVFQE